MNYCSQCGYEIAVKVPPGDHLPRFVCERCGTIHYQNPKLIAGCLSVWQDRILICRRAIEPRLGYWTLPAGFMENGETTEQAAARETVEEALADVRIIAPLALVNVPRISQVHLMFRGELREERYGAGPESLDARLIEEQDIPWDELAFPSVRYTLQCFLEDRRKGAFGFHITTWDGTPHV